MSKVVFGPSSPVPPFSHLRSPSLTPLASRKCSYNMGEARFVPDHRHPSHHTAQDQQTFSNLSIRLPDFDHPTDLPRSLCTTYSQTPTIQPCAQPRDRKIQRVWFPLFAGSLLTSRAGSSLIVRNLLSHPAQLAFPSWTSSNSSHPIKSFIIWLTPLINRFLRTMIPQCLLPAVRQPTSSPCDL